MIPVHCFDNGLSEWTKKLVKAWVDRLRHTLAIRIEGFHAKLKTYLAALTLDLNVYDKNVLSR